MAITWTNWSGSVRAEPRELLRPRTEGELAAIVARSSSLRVAGAGHSFMPLCETSGTSLDLRALEGTLEIEPDGASAWVPAGWSLRNLTPQLWDKGFSLVNQGDVDPQSLAGALATGTHGTGADLGSLSTAARAFRMLLADGTITTCSPEDNPELFEAQRLSLGLLGVALRVRIEVLPAYRLEERIFTLHLDEAEAQFAELAARYRHVEFFLFPYTTRAIVKTLHPTSDQRGFQPPSASDERMFELACEASARLPASTPVVQKVMTRLVRPSHRVGPAHRIFPTERTVRFEEMEYELPREAGFAALREAAAWIRKQRHPVAFPFEYRWTAGDDLWLSPFNRGPCASISLHQYSALPWQTLFAETEPIFRAHGGRPHWAKRHTLGAADVRALYPEAERFARVREQYDPEAKFANRHLRELFSIEPRTRSRGHAE